MLKCLHLADLHLGWSPHWLGEREADYREKRDRLLSDLTPLVIDPAQDLDVVLIVGDLFETHRPQASLVERVIAELEVWQDAGLTLITVPGNHDEFTYHDGVYRLYGERWPGILVTNPLPGPPLELSVRGQTVYLYSVAYAAGLTQFDGFLKPYPRVDKPGIHLGAFHAALDWQSAERHLPLASADLVAAAYDYVALGHLHSQRRERKGRTVWAYPGAIYSKGFDDIGSGCLTFVKLEPGRAEVETVPWQKVDHRILPLDMGSFPDSEALAEAIKELADPAVLLRVELRGAAGFFPDPEVLQGRLARHFYHLEIRDGSLYLAPELRQTWAGEATIRGEFVRRLEARLAAALTDEERNLILQALRLGMGAFLEAES